MLYEVKPRDYREAFWAVKDRLGGIAYGAANTSGIPPEDALRIVGEAAQDMLDSLAIWLEPVRCDEYSYSCLGACECGAEREAKRV